MGLSLDNFFSHSPPMMLSAQLSDRGVIIDKEASLLGLDFGISVSNMGHSHPKIVEVVQTRQRQGMCNGGELIQNSQTAYAKALTDHLPSKLNTAYYVSLALKQPKVL